MRFSHVLAVAVALSFGTVATVPAEANWAQSGWGKKNCPKKKRNGYDNYSSSKRQQGWSTATATESGQRN